MSLAIKNTMFVPRKSCFEVMSHICLSARPKTKVEHKSFLVKFVIGRGPIKPWMAFFTLVIGRQTYNHCIIKTFWEGLFPRAIPMYLNLQGVPQ